MSVVLKLDVKWIPFRFQLGDDSAIKKTSLVMRGEFEEQRKEVFQLRDQIKEMEKVIAGFERLKSDNT